MVDEALGLIIFVLGESFFLLDFAVLTSLSAAEKDSPDEDNDVSNDHTNEAGSYTDNDANHNRNEDMENDAPEEAGKSTMSVVVTVWAMRPLRTRASVAMRSHSRTMLRTMSTWAGLSSAPLNLRELISDNRSPFADHSRAFLVSVCGLRCGALSRDGNYLDVPNHELSARCLEYLHQDSIDSIDERISYFEDFNIDVDEIKLFIVGRCGV